MEMSGLNPDSDRVLEIAVVVTDAELEVIAEGPVLVIAQPERVLQGMDSWNTATHGRSGLTNKVRASTLDEATASDVLIEFLQRHVPPASRRCAATRSARTGASWRAGCRGWRRTSTTATSTSAR